MNAVRAAAKQAVQVVRYVWSHPANHGARSRALLRAAAFQVRGRLHLGVVRARVGNSLFLEAPLHAASASKAVYANPPDWPEMQAWRRLLRPGDLFVDVGSNAGLYSVWAADCGAVPIAVEPDPVNAQRTRRNLELNGVPVEVHECALGAEEGSMTFTVDDDSTNHLVTASTSERTRAVDVRTLDSVLAGRRVRGIKIDVEGAERLVVEGGSATLGQQRVDILQLEWNALSRTLLSESRDEVKNLLAEYGYRFCEPNPANDFALIPISPSPTRDADVFAVCPRLARELRIGK